MFKNKIIIFIYLLEKIIFYLITWWTNFLESKDIISFSECYLEILQYEEKLKKYVVIKFIELDLYNMDE